MKRVYHFISYIDTFVFSTLCVLHEHQPQLGNRRCLLYMRDSQYSPQIFLTYTSLITLTNSKEDPGCFCDTNPSF